MEESQTERKGQWKVNGKQKGITEVAAGNLGGKGVQLLPRDNLIHLKLFLHTYFRPARQGYSSELDQLEPPHESNLQLSAKTQPNKQTNYGLRKMKLLEKQA